MALTISLKSELEARLQEVAASRGLDANTYVAGTLEERLRRVVPQVPSHLNREEAALLQKINQGLSEDV